MCLMLHVDLHSTCTTLERSRLYTFISFMQIYNFLFNRGGGGGGGTQAQELLIHAPLWNQVDLHKLHANINLI